MSYPGQDEQSLAHLSAEEKSGVFFVNIKNKTELYQSYMPFITGGAIFIQTEKEYSLGDEVFLLVKLMEEPEKYPIAGVVAWITPKCAQGGRASGIGVRFASGEDEESEEVRNKIETYLAGALQSERHTDTM